MYIKKENRIIKVMSYILVILLLIGLVGFLARYTNDFTDDFKTFYIETNGQKITTNNTTLLLQRGETQFSCKYTFGFLSNKEPKGYKVKIVPNATSENNFDFIVDGQYYSFNAIEDLTNAFDITKDIESFKINIPPNANLNTILQSIYPDKTISLPDNINDGYKFKLIISSYNDKISYEIAFAIFISVDGVMLDKEEILI